MSTVAPPAAVGANPFVGPRSLQQGEPIHGRDREIRRLTHLLVAERIVLLYSPSGAGKTSLISAGLVPRLEARRFQVSPIIRVSLRPPGTFGGVNRYLVSTLQSLEAGLRPHRQRGVQELLELGLERYLDEWARMDEHGAGNELLIFDQFEEVLVLDPSDHAAKTEFFRALGAALEERGRWALFSMREDYIAGLDPYVTELPTRLHTRLRLDLLSPDAARSAAESAAAAAGRPFTDEAASTLIENLRRVQAQREGQLVYVPGPVVEPLQLQVVCRRLWGSLAPDADRITDADVARLGRVQDALADYYATEVRSVAERSGVPERVIRDWLGKQLITEEGVRRQQQRGPGADPAAAEHAVRLLEDAHLIRGEARRGTRWLELAHDQLVEPIQENNASYQRAHMSTLEQLAQRWADAGRAPELLVDGALYRDVATWAAERSDQLTEVESSFLNASAQAEQERRRRRRTTIFLRWISGALAVALVGAAVLWQSAERSRDEADSRALAAEAMTRVTVDPAHALETAERALSTAYTAEGELALRRALALNPPSMVVEHDDLVAGSPEFSADGTLMLTASWDGTARLWDSETGAEHGRIEHDTRVVEARFSPDGDSVLTLTLDGTLRLWRIDEFDEPAMTSEGLWTPLTFSPDGSRVVAAENGDTGVVHVLDAATGERISLEGHTDLINSVDISPDGALVLTASADSTARVWGAATGRQVASLEGHGTSVYKAEFRDDMRAIATGDANGWARIWRWPDPGEPLEAGSGQHAGTLVTFAPDGSLLTYNDKTPVLLDGETGHLLRSFEGHRSWTIGVRFDEERGRLVTGNMDGTARVWDVTTGRELAVLRGHESGLTGVAVDPSGERVVTASGNHVRLFQVPEQQVFHGFTDWVLDAVSFRDGTRVAGSGQDGRVVVWDADGGIITERQFGSGQIVDIAVDPEGDNLAVAALDGTVSVWDWDRDEVVAEAFATNALDVSFDRTGEQLSLASNWWVQVWHWETEDQPGPRLTEEALGVGYRATFSPTENSVAVSRGRLLEIWDPDEAARRVTMEGHDGDIADVQFSPDGRLVVSAAEDGTARIWRSSDGILLHVLRGHDGVVWAAAFDESGERVVTAGEGGFVGVWNVADGRNLALLQQHPDTVNSVQFVDGGDGRILTASDDATVRIFRCETCGPLEQLLDRAAALPAAD